MIGFTDGSAREWAASILSDEAKSWEEAGHITEGEDDGLKDGIARLKELEEKLLSLDEPLTNDEWQDVLMYIHQVLAD